MLTLTADDFGIGYETSRGIVDAHLAGAVDATSVMTVTGDHLERSMPLLGRAPKLRLGLHLTFTSRAGKLLSATRSSGLVGRDGFPHSLPKLYLRCRLGRVSPAAVRDEIVAQVERFVRVLGRRPDHVDGHHHAHQLPVIRNVVAELLSASVLPARIRNTVEPEWLHAVPGDRFRRNVICQLGRRSRAAFLAAGGQVPNGFFGVLSPDMLASADPFAAYLARVPADGRWEMMVHPGHADPTLAGRDTYLTERQVELGALLSLGHRRAAEG